jgi:PRTRC genetic system protein A
MTVDDAILQAFPLLATPVSGQLPDAKQDGMRFAAAKDGVWREITLPWIRVRHRISETGVAMPYGELQPAIDFRCGAVPIDLVRQFAADARSALPNEIAAAFIWNSATDGWRYARRAATFASADRIEYREIRLEDEEQLVVDVHSHGNHPASFSSTDDVDDHGTMKVCLVLGNLDLERPSSAMRLCMAGWVTPIRMGANGEMEACL